MSTDIITSTRNIASPFEIVHDILNGKGPDSKGFYQASCPGPAHKNHDKNASMSYREMEDGGVYLNCFAGCTRSEILNALGLNERDLHTASKGYKPKYRRYSASLSLIELASQKLIPTSYLSNFGVTDEFKYTTEKGNFEAVRISYRLRDGSEHTKKRIRYGTSGHDTCFIKEDPGTPIPYGLWKLDEAEKAGYLPIVEGESDPWTCWFHGIPCLGIPGAGMVKAIDGKELASIPLLYIIQEPDQVVKAANLNVAATGFYSKMYKQLRSTGYTGKIYYVDFEKLTGYKDPNAMHQALVKDKTSDLFKSLFEEALQKADPAGDDNLDEQTQAMQQDAETQLDALRAVIDAKDIDALWDNLSVLAQLEVKDQESWLRSIKTAFGKDININSVRKVIAVAQKQQAESDRKDMDTVALLFSEQYSDTWAYDIFAQTWRKFTGTHWAEPASEKDGETELDRLIVDLLHALGFDVKSSSMLDIVHRLARGLCKRQFVTRTNAVNFHNGTLDVRTNDLQTHRREDNFLYCLDYAYEAASDYPQTRAFYESVLVNENAEGTEFVPDHHAIQAVMAQFGLALLGDMKMHRILFMLGAPRAGKSTIMRHGNAICGNVQIHAAMTEEKYGAFAGDALFFSELEGKRVRFQRNKQRLVCADEIKPETIRDNEGVFKNMSAHSGVDMRGMNKDDQIDNTWRPKLIISSNEKPRYKDTSGAIAKRIIYLATPRERSEQEQDLNLLDKLIGERGAFAQDCIKVALAALEHGYISKSHWMKDHAKEAEIVGNALKAFIEEYCVLGKDEKVHTDRLYQAFMSYRERDGHSGQYAKLTMVAGLKEMNKGIGAYENAQRIDGEQKRAMYGIRLKTEDELRADDQITTQFQDDPLLIPALAHAQVLRCDSAVTINLAYRNGLEAACRATSQDCCYDVTNISQKKASVDTFLSENDTKVGTLEGCYSEKYSSHRNGNLLNQPVEPSQPRYDSKKTTVTDCHIVTPSHVRTTEVMF